MTQPDVFYIHGFEGRSQGTKGRWLQSKFSCCGVDMPGAKSSHPLGMDAPVEEVIAEARKAVDACVAFLRPHIRAHLPRVVVASSFGTAVWLRLVRSEGYRVPSVLLAPACEVLGVGAAFPVEMRTILIHSPQDEVIPFASAQAVHAASGPRSELWTIDDTHKLARLTKDRPELLRAVQKLLLEQGSPEEQAAAARLVPPFAAESVA